jgi:hypothetical protein
LIFFAAAIFAADFRHFGWLTLSPPLAFTPGCRHFFFRCRHYAAAGYAFAIIFAAIAALSVAIRYMLFAVSLRRRCCR